MASKTKDPKTSKDSANPSVVTALGESALTGLSGKVGGAVAKPVSKHTRWSEQQIRTAIGLALLLFMPLPFIRGFGVGGLIIPAVSVLAAVTFLPVILSFAGQRLDRVRLLPKSWLEHRADH